MKTTDNAASSSMLQELLRAGFAFIAVFLCVWALTQSWRAGSARTFAEFALSSDWVYAMSDNPVNLLAPANEAIRVKPADPLGYYARAILLDYIGENKDASEAIEQGIALRPQDFLFWIRLGEAREHAGDFDGARAAYEQAVLLAPGYAKPHFHLGNLLLRFGKNAEAFDELRSASRSAPSLLPFTIQLAWNAYKGDPRAVIQAIRPQNETQRLALARYFAQQGATMPAELSLATDRTRPPAERKGLVNDLIAAKRFSEAYEIWVSLRGQSGADTKNFGRGNITDGGFESDITTDAIGFDWRLARDVQATRIALDTDRPHGGARSLRVDFTGETDQAARFISQITTVESKARYRLKFFARTQEVVSGGMPIVAVYDAGASNPNEAAKAAVRPEKLLEQSKSFPPNASDWQEFTVDFTTPANCEAVIIALQRQRCNVVPCEIYGRIWTDDFALTKMQ
ncbi:MAG: hypothetical protein NVSMB56_11100 [Pyrinomonadaceae bacterium]